MYCTINDFIILFSQLSHYVMSIQISNGGSEDKYIPVKHAADVPASMRMHALQFSQGRHRLHELMIAGGIVRTCNSARDWPDCGACKRLPETPPQMASVCESYEAQAIRLQLGALLRLVSS